MTKDADFYRHVGRRIAELRRDKLTQKQLSDQVTLSRTSIANIEKGRQQVLLHHAMEIAQALGVDVSALLPASLSEPAERLQSQLQELPAKQKRWVESSVRRPTTRRRGKAG